MVYRSLLAPMLAAAALAVVAPVRGQIAEDSNVVVVVRGERFTGTFSLRTPLGQGQVSTAFMSLHSDGTVSQTSINPAYSAINGVWQKTGPRTIQITEFTFISMPTAGFLGIGRSRMELEFSDDFKTFVGKAYNEGVQCQTWQTCPDPFDPNTKWSASSSQPGSISGTRASALPFGPLT